MTKKIFATLMAAIYIAGAVAVLTGCNTVEGVGKDIEKGGQNLKDEAKEHKNY